MRDRLMKRANIFTLDGGDEDVGARKPPKHLILPNVFYG